MKQVKLFLVWTPRLATLIMILGLILFTIEPFSGSGSGLDQLIAWILHYSPVIILLIIFGITYFKPLFGGTFFSVLGLLYILWMAIEQSPAAYTAALYYGVSDVLIGILYYFDYKLRD